MAISLTLQQEYIILKKVCQGNLKENKKSFYIILLDKRLKM